VRGLPAVRRVLPHLEGRVSAVGGVVRDALLGRPGGADVDLVVEGDALALAARLGRALGVRVQAHPRFGTATLELPHGEGHLDVITARRERYPHPGALPEVEPGTLGDDLARRDVTVNAMALRLSGPGTGDLVDPHGGERDLRRGVVRALRAGAFAEDPSRVVRAARYAGRLGFRLDPGTGAEARGVAPGLRWASSRVAEELRRLLEEDDPVPGLVLLAELGAPGVRPAPGAAVAALDRAAATPGAPDLPRWALRLSAALDPAARAQAALPGWARAVAAEADAGPDLADRVRAAGAPSAVDALLRPAPPAAAVAALAAGAGAVAGWWARGRDVRLAIDGSDLVRAGVRPGPAIGRALAAARAAVVDGRAEDREAQLALALAEAGRAG